MEWYRIRKHSENAKTDAVGLHNYRLLAVMHSDSLRKMAFYGKLFCMWNMGEGFQEAIWLGCENSI